MRLLVVYPYFVDQSAAGHSLMHDTLLGLARMGHQVTVVSGEGGYMQGAHASARPWWRRLIYRDQVGPIRVLRTLSYSGHQKGLLGRLLSYGFLSILNPLAVLLAPAADAALLSPPPLYPIFTSLLACRLRRWPVVTEVRDLWPGSIVEMGLMKNRWLVRLTAWMERVVYDHSAHVVGLTQGIVRDIQTRGWERVHCLPCAVDTAQMRPRDEARNTLRAARGWHDRFVLMYFGALGEANNLPVLLRAAERLQTSCPRLVLVLVGDGFRRQWCEDEVRRLALANVQVVPAVPRSEAPSWLVAADACVVTLQDLPVFAGAIPTKMLEYMACGRPVLCGVRGEALAILEAAGAGDAFEPDDDAALARLAQDLQENPQRARRLGDKGRAYVRAHFDIKGRVARMAALLENAGRRARAVVS